MTNLVNFMIFHSPKGCQYDLYRTKRSLETIQDSGLVVDHVVVENCMDLNKEISRSNADFTICLISGDIIPVSYILNIKKFRGTLISENYAYQPRFSISNKNGLICGLNHDIVKGTFSELLLLYYPYYSNHIAFPTNTLKLASKKIFTSSAYMWNLVNFLVHQGGSVITLRDTWTYEFCGDSRIQRLRSNKILNLAIPCRYTNLESLKKIYASYYTPLVENEKTRVIQLENKKELKKVTLKRRLARATRPLRDKLALVGLKKSVPNVVKTKKSVPNVVKTKKSVPIPAKVYEELGKYNRYNYLIRGYKEINVANCNIIDKNISVSALRSLFELPKSNYEFIFCIPNLRNGGVDKILLHYLKVISLGLNKNCLVIVENSIETDWEFSSYADILVIPPDMKRFSCLKVFLTFLIGHIKPDVFFNFNNRLGYQTFYELRENLSNYPTKFWTFIFAHWIRPEDKSEFGMVHDYLPKVFEHLDLIISDNQTFVNYLIKQYGFDQNRFEVFYNPITTQEQPKPQRSLNHSEFKILWASAITQGKGLEYLLEVALNLEDASIAIDIFGNQKHHGDSRLYSSVVKADTTESNISYKGGFNDFAAIPNIAHYDLFIFTSEMEGMPNIILEAARENLLILTTDVGGITELITDGETGYIISDIKDIESTITKIRELIELPSETKDKVRNNLYKKMQLEFSEVSLLTKLEKCELV